MNFQNRLTIAGALITALCVTSLAIYASDNLRPADNPENSFDLISVQPQKNIRSGIPGKGVGGSASPKTRVIKSSKHSDDHSGYMPITAYGFDSCEKCNHKWGTVYIDDSPIGSKGIPLTEGISVAVPEGFQEGCAIEIFDLGTFAAVDTSPDNTIGIFFSSHEKAVEFGTQTVYIKMITK